MQHFAFIFCRFMWFFFYFIFIFYFFFLTVGLSGGRTHILTGHPACILAGVFTFCSASDLPPLSSFEPAFGFISTTSFLSLCGLFVDLLLLVLFPPWIRRAVSMSSLMPQASSFPSGVVLYPGQGKHPLQSGFVPYCLCGACDKRTTYRTRDAPGWAGVWAFPFQHCFLKFKSHSTHPTDCAKPGENGKCGTTKAGSTQALGHRSLCNRFLSRTLTASDCSAPGKGAGPVPRSWFKSEVGWHCLLRPEACAVPVPCPWSPPPSLGAYGAGGPARALVGKGDTILLTSANPARHVEGQQNVMLTCRVADGTRDWLSPSHPPTRTCKTGKDLFSVALHALQSYRRAGLW